MKTEFRLANTLKELMSENYPLNDISVNLLTKRCKVSRPTFYYHFHDIYDLVTLIFLNETIQEIKKAKTLPKLIECIYDYYAANENFVNVILASSAKDLFQEFIANNCYQAFNKMLLTLDEDKHLTLTERKHIARFYSTAFASSITFYFETAREKSISGLEKMIGFVDELFLERSIKNVAKTKEKEKKAKYLRK